MPVWWKPTAEGRKAHITWNHSSQGTRAAQENQAHSSMQSNQSLSTFSAYKKTILWPTVTTKVASKNWSDLRAISLAPWNNLQRDFCTQAEHAGRWLHPGAVHAARVCLGRELLASSAHRERPGSAQELLGLGTHTLTGWSPADRLLSWERAWKQIKVSEEVYFKVFPTARQIIFLKVQLSSDKLTSQIRKLSTIIKA